LKPRIVLRKRRVNRAEGALVDGRHPGSIKLSPLTRRWWRRAWWFVAAEVGREAAVVRDGSRQRVSEAASHARFTVENTVTGSVCRRGCRSQLRQDREAPSSGGIQGQKPSHHRAGRDNAEAGGSPSSEAPPRGPQEASAEGGPAFERRAARPRGRRAGNRWVRRCSCRRSVAEVGRRIFFVSRSVCREAGRAIAG
jgi:hypothetical protein